MSSQVMLPEKETWKPVRMRGIRIERPQIATGHKDEAQTNPFGGWYIAMLGGTYFFSVLSFCLFLSSR